MRVSDSLSSLAALLLLGGARAACGGGRGPEMTVIGPTIQNCELSEYCLEYGEELQLHCSSDDTGDLAIRRKDLATDNLSDLPAVTLNATTILSVLKPTLGLYIYTCIDSKSGCQRSLSLHHQPALYISSLRAVLLTDYSESGHRYYFVPYGDDYKIICVGIEHQKLHIYTESDDIGISKDPTGKSEIRTDTVNDTSIAHSARADQVGLAGELEYECRADAGGYQVLLLTVDHFPEAYNLSCISYDGELNFECSWNISSVETTFKLYYKDKLLCFVMARSASSCKWLNIFMGQRLIFRFSSQDYVSLVMRTCNNVICNNQTFTFKFYSMIKKAPVVELNELNTSSTDSLISWRSKCLFGEHCNYKVEYRLLAFGEEWRQTDASSVRCAGDVRCQYRLALPYPDTKYEVQVFNRHEAATDDRLWSDPASVSVGTAPRAACACAPLDATCEACELTQYINKKNLALRNFKSNLKLKRVELIEKRKLLEKWHSLSISTNKQS